MDLHNIPNGTTVYALFIPTGKEQFEIYKATIVGYRVPDESMGDVPCYKIEWLGKDGERLSRLHPVACFEKGTGDFHLTLASAKKRQLLFARNEVSHHKNALIEARNLYKRSIRNANASIKIAKQKVAHIKKLKV